MQTFSRRTPGPTLKGVDDNIKEMGGMRGGGLGRKVMEGRIGKNGDGEERRREGKGQKEGRRKGQ